MADPYEAFKRKHLSQNKEIIHKNSELTKSNADLQRRLSLLRAENLSLKGAHFQLEVEASTIRDKLERAEHRIGLLETRLDRERHKPGSIDHIQAETVRNVLLQALAAYDNLVQPSHGLTASYPSSSQLSSPSSSLSESLLPPPPADPTSNVDISRRRSLAARSARPSLSTRPDLSHISEDADGVSEVEEEQDDAQPPPQPSGWTVLEGLREESSQGSLSQIWTGNNEPASPSPAEGPSSRPSPVQEKPAPPTVAVRRGGRASSVTQRAVQEPEEVRPTKIERKPRESSSALKSAKGKERQVDEALERERRALKEVQREEQLPQRRRRTIIRQQSSSESEDDQPPAIEEEQEEELPSAGQPLDDSSAAEEEPEEIPVLKPKPRARQRLASVQNIAPTSPEQRVETVSGAAGKQLGPRKVKPLEIVSEEAKSSVAGGEMEEAHEGRRARKSVNYALPKLNTKMRKPEDYVGFSTATKGPRKSTVPRAPRLAGGFPHSSSQPERPPTSAHAVPPRPTSSQPTPAVVESESSDDEMRAVERAKARRASSIAASKALREMRDLDDGPASVGTAAGRRYSAFA